MQNALAAISAALLMDIDPFVVQAGVVGFEPVPHRLETVRELDEVIWINDSKATNVEAGLVALEAMDRLTVLIAGGRAKGGDFKGLRTGKLDCLRRVILIGEAAGAIEHDIADLIEVTHADDMADAVSKARTFACEGDAVLLSPLCASFDMFKDFEDRGDTFMRLVMELPGRS